MSNSPPPANPAPQEKAYIALAYADVDFTFNRSINRYLVNVGVRRFCCRILQMNRIQM